jgi:hypothetical protein
MKMKLDVTPVNQISPRYTVEIRTKTLRRALRDLRQNANEISRASAWATHEIHLDDGRMLVTFREQAADGNSYLMGTLEATLVGVNHEPIRSYTLR